MGKSMTSEEKLLKLIRKKGNNPDAPAELLQGSASTPGKKRKKPKRHFLKLINRLLILGIIALIAAVVMKYFVSQQESADLLKEQDVIEKEGGQGLIQIPKQKPFSYYQSRIDKRNIFRSPWEKPKAGTSGQQSGPISDLANEFKIVGIVVDDSPNVILEDVKTNETFFVAEGESIKGATIEKIEEDKVIFIYNGETIELAP